MYHWQDVSKLGEGEMIVLPMHYDVLMWYTTTGGRCPVVHFNVCTVNKVGKLHLARVSLLYRYASSCKRKWECM